MTQYESPLEEATKKGHFIDCLRLFIMYGTILLVYGSRLYSGKLALSGKLCWLSLHTSQDKCITCVLMLLCVCIGMVSLTGVFPFLYGFTWCLQ